MIWFLIVILSAALDLGIKKWIRDHKEEHSRQAVLGGRIILTKYFNPGAMLGFLKSKTRLLAAMTVGLVGCLTGGLVFAVEKREHAMTCLGLSLMLGGALSNAYERLRYGKVTDYFRISIGLKRLEKLVFNLGDFCIFLGTLLTAIGSLRHA